MSKKNQKPESLFDQDSDPGSGDGGGGLPEGGIGDDSGSEGEGGLEGSSDGSPFSGQGDDGSDNQSEDGPDVITIPEVTVEGVPPVNLDRPIEFDPIGQALAGGLIAGPAAALESGLAGLGREGIAGLVESSPIFGKVEEAAGEVIREVLDHIPPLVADPDVPSAPDPQDGGTGGEDGGDGGDGGVPHP